MMFSILDPVLITQSTPTVPRVIPSLLASAAMDLYTLIPRTLVGVVYPAFMSLKSVLHGSPESAGAWLRYWVVLGVFSLVELLLDPVINPLR